MICKLCDEDKQIGCVVDDNWICSDCLSHVKFEVDAVIDRHGASVSVELPGHVLFSLELLTIMLVGLKLTNLIDWSWTEVLFPLWGTFVACVLVCCVRAVWIYIQGKRLLKERDNADS